MAYSIDDTIRAAVQDGFDFLIDELGKQCTLYYPELKEECINCLFNPATGVSANYHRDGGPIFFPPNNTCPMCNGAGVKLIEQKETIKLRLIWKDKIERVDNKLPIVIPGALLETRGYTRDVPKILKAIFLETQTPTQGYKTTQYKRVTFPGDKYSIIQNRYFSCQWEQIR